MALDPTVKKLISSAWADDHPCLVATNGKDGPNVSPKGSLIVYDDQHFAYWERSKRKALENVQHDNRVCIVYANMTAQKQGIVKAGIMRFYGTAELHESGPVKDKIFSMLSKREQEHEGADTGIGVLVRIERGTDSRGESLI